MSRRRDDEDAAGFHRPFRDLGKVVDLPRAAPVRVVPRLPARRAPSVTAKPAPREDEEALFRKAVEGVVPMPPSSEAAPPPPQRRRMPTTAERDQAEALAALSDLVAGGGRFDVSDSDEHVEGMVIGLDPRILGKLRAGEFAPKVHLDLHGMTADEASPAVRSFVLRALRAGHRCILVVHGRGRNSPDRRPVLKDRLKMWLTHGELARVVLAFASARPHDGGSGAMYVLLRRERRGKKPFHTFDGAKAG